jgi:hypothetical protein
MSRRAADATLADLGGPSGGTSPAFRARQAQVLDHDDRGYG